MELVNTRNTGEYFTYNGVNAHKFCFNKFVTEDGRVFTLNRSSAPSEVSKGTNAQGYRQLRYQEESYGMIFNTSVHQRVAKSFIDNPDNYEVVDHINENKADNRVENLRWTTLKGNVDYYHFKDNREIEELKKLNKELADKNREHTNLIKKLQEEKDKLYKLQEELVSKLTSATAQAKEIIDIYASRNMPEDKFKDKVEDTKGVMFGSVDAMIAEVSKPVKIDKVSYRSIKEAVRYLASQPDVTAKPETLRKEIRNLINGIRPPWNYLGKYYIEV